MVQLLLRRPTNLRFIKKLVTLVTGGGTWKELEDVGCVLHYSWGAINQFHLTVPKGALNSYFSNVGFAFDYNLCEINSRSWRLTLFTYIRKASFSPQNFVIKVCANFGKIMQKSLLRLCVEYVNFSSKNLKISSITRFNGCSVNTGVFSIIITQYGYSL